VNTMVPLSSSQGVSDLVRHLTSPQARERLSKAGYTPPQ